MPSEAENGYGEDLGVSSRLNKLLASLKKVSDEADDDFRRAVSESSSSVTSTDSSTPLTFLVSVRRRSSVSQGSSKQRERIVSKSKLMKPYLELSKHRKKISKLTSLEESISEGSEDLVEHDIAVSKALEVLHRISSLNKVEVGKELLEKYGKIKVEEENSDDGVAWGENTKEIFGKDSNENEEDLRTSEEEENDNEGDDSGTIEDDTVDLEINEDVVGPNQIDKDSEINEKVKVFGNNEIDEDTGTNEKDKVSGSNEIDEDTITDENGSGTKEKDSGINDNDAETNEELETEQKVEIEITVKKEFNKEEEIFQNDIGKEEIFKNCFEEKEKKGDIKELTKSYLKEEEKTNNLLQNILKNETENKENKFKDDVVIENYVKEKKTAMKPFEDDNKIKKIYLEQPMIKDIFKDNTYYLKKEDINKATNKYERQKEYQLRKDQDRNDFVERYICKNKREVITSQSIEINDYFSSFIIMVENISMNTLKNKLNFYDDDELYYFCSEFLISKLMPEFLNLNAIPFSIIYNSRNHRIKKRILKKYPRKYFNIVLLYENDNKAIKSVERRRNNFKLAFLNELSK